MNWRGVISHPPAAVSMRQYCENVIIFLAAYAKRDAGVAKLALFLLYQIASRLWYRQEKIRHDRLAAYRRRDIRCHIQHKRILP
jgi:hypothetical protein